jgi:glycosyltransferase involved in cell wall biosynthesis
LTENFPFITVVIPIKNEARFIESTIKKILEQDYPSGRFEIIVACGNSEDNSSEIVRRLASEDSRIRMFDNLVGKASGGRNLGIRNARGEIILFIDGHTYIKDKELLKNTVRLMEEKKVSVLSRPQFLEPPDNNVFQQAVALARKSVIGHGLDSTIYTDKEIFVAPTSSGATYRKELFEQFGYYDESFDACEDVEFNYRLTKAGIQSFTSMKLAVYYYPRESLGALFHQMKRYGVGRFRLARKHPDTLGLGSLIPVLFTAGMPLLFLLGVVVKPAMTLFLMLSLLYLLVILAASLLISVRHGFRFLALLPPIFFTIHTGLGWGFLTEATKTWLTSRSPSDGDSA